ncbi:MAG: translation initiation factor IF-2 subunit gamma [Candidatus Aenigmarchaeota archaeon]|nr:translation initiation factor IF-2 subunit gamma [Candidatus Aenigmarchaeota archaeon]
MIEFTKPLPEINIGIVGHVDHGKTTLTERLTGKWTDTHSEEIKRGITIRLGYADVTFYYCEKCRSHCNAEKCKKCFGECAPKRTVSIIDAPGHETLMATVLSGTALMNGAVMLIAANEKCPQPQTAEHLKALDVAGVKHIVIVQNKIDLVSEERAKQHYEEIRNFVKGTVAENAPIIPISAIHDVNIDFLIEAIDRTIPTPKRDSSMKPRFFIARSFDVNKPGTEIKKLKGGIIGGSVIRGVFKKGDSIEISPGAIVNGKWETLKTKIDEIVQSSQNLDEAKHGGLASIATMLDPSITKSDGLAGHVAGLEGELPESRSGIKIKPKLFDYVVGISGQQKVQPIKTGDALMLTAGIAKTVASVSSAQADTAELKLKIPICAEKSDRVAISKQVGGRWHLIGVGEIVG